MDRGQKDNKKEKDRECEQKGELEIEQQRE